MDSPSQSWLVLTIYKLYDSTILLIYTIFKIKILELSGDNTKLKELTLCNFDFLLAAVRTISVSYLRSILEHARCYVLDRDVELVYYTVRKSSDVLTRDTLQLGAQIISWLRPVAGKRKLGNYIHNSHITRWVLQGWINWIFKKI